MSIINKIVDIMDNNNLKQTDLCQYLNINPSVFTTWKSRCTDPPVKYLIQICEFLNVSPYYLLTGKEKSSFSDLTEEEQECLQKFKNLSPIDRGRILERMDVMYNAYTPEQKENVS